jgi:hypothetical protein
MRLHMNAQRLPLSWLAVLVAAGCATQSPVRVDRADADLTACRSFNWLQPSGAPASLTDQRVRAAALAQLESKGYTIDGNAPGCRISYVLATAERPQAKPRIGVGAGGGSRGIGGGIGVSLPVGKQDRYGGTLALDVIDVTSNAQIWSGALDLAFAHAELSEDEVREAVKVILAQYPDRN